jgi:signal transduction histidine kinase
MRLFSKTIKTYLVYSVIVFMVTVPIFYFAVRSVLLHSVDRSLKTQLREIRSNLDPNYSPEDLAIWAKLDKDILLTPVADTIPDRVYTIYRFNEKHHEDEPYREVEGILSTGGRLYRLEINISLVENEDLLGSILWVQATLLVVLMGGMLWINHQASRKLWRPFYVALKNMQEIELHKNTELQLKESDIEEFNELNKVITGMFRRNYEIYLQQKEFTENAAHEMQTPLAIFRSKVELLMQTAPLTQEQAELINDLDTANRRLVKLNKSLLLLTKIENNQYQEVEDVSVVALCEKQIASIGAYGNREGIVLERDITGDPVVRANPMLVEILIGNLLSNAYRYNMPNGTVMVRISSHELIVQNTGGSSPLDGELIFDRFQKQHDHPESIGLGLAIVKNICAVYRYEIFYSYQGGMHTFAVRFSN